MCYSTSCAGNCRGRACKRFINYQCVFGQSVYVMVQLLFLFLGGGGIACVHVCAFSHECTCMCFPLTRAQDCVLGHTSIHMMHIAHMCTCVCTHTCSTYMHICARAYANTHVFIFFTCRIHLQVRMHTHMYSYVLHSYALCAHAHTCAFTHNYAHTLFTGKSKGQVPQDLPEKAKHSHQRPL